MSSENNNSETHASTDNYKLYLMMIMPILLGSILVLLCRCIVCSCNKTNRTFSYTLHTQSTAAAGDNFQSTVNGPSLKQRNETDDPPSYIQVVLDDLSVGQSKFPPVKSSSSKTQPSVHKKDKSVKLNKMFSFWKFILNYKPHPFYLWSYEVDP